MNERIRELVEQAWNYVDSQNPYASDEHEMFQEKFAELIIKECASVVEQQGVDPAFKHMLSWAIKKRFGIEE